MVFISPAEDYLFLLTTPIPLTIGLAAITILLYWLTRPRTKDVFWDIETIGPREKLQRISEEAQSDPVKASDSLLALLQAYPDFQPARLYYSAWHYQQKNHQEALDGYETAFELGTANPIDYLRASLAAAKLGQVRKALLILHSAEKLLPKNRFSGVMSFNMGCYNARLGNHDRAVPCLLRAYRAGFRKEKSYLEDRDLDPLRSRADFQTLMKQLQKKNWIIAFFSG